MSTLSLKAALAKTATPEAWVEFKEGISFQLRYFPKARFRALADKHTEIVYNPQAKARAPKLNTEEFTKAFMKEVVLGWKGVTLDSLSKLCEIDISSYTREELVTELPFSVEELQRLTEMVYDIDPFINEACMNLGFFRPQLEDEAKNSNASPTTS